MLVGLCTGTALVRAEGLCFSKACTRCKASSLIHRGVRRGMLFVSVCQNRAAAESQVPSAVRTGGRTGAYG